MKKTILAVVAINLLPACLYAVDGVVLINQSVLTTAGGTYTINNPGSYKLSGNLIAKDQNTDLIVIAADHVTIDLNGFSILGTADCSAAFPCTNKGTGRGITTAGVSHYEITIRNGTIHGMGARGIDVTGYSDFVDCMHVRSNGSDGIAIGGGLVQNSNVEQNGGTGILIASEASVSRNFISSNALWGIRIVDQGNYIGNVIVNKPDTGEQVLGGTNQGQNYCNVSGCPAPVF